MPPQQPQEILDAHHHVWDLSVREQPFLHSHPDLAPLRRNFTVADLTPLAAAAGVTGTVVVQTVAEPGETPELLALAAGAGAGAAGPSLIRAAVGWVDVTAPGVADALAALLAGPGGDRLAGIRHPVLTEPDEEWLARPEVLRGLAAVGAAGLTFDLVVRPAQLPSAVAAARAVPGLVLVLDHLGNVDPEPEVDEAWAAAFRLLARQPSTVGKLSGILADPSPDGPPGDVTHLRPYYDLALECFGPDRLMFGTDWPVSTLGAPYGDVVAAAQALTADLSEPERAAIFAGTARRVYRIAG
jgi:L-fuconolactonase